MKQPDTWSCQAVCAVMVTGTTLQDFVEFVGHDGSGYCPESKHPDKRIGFSLIETAKFLLEHGYLLGALFVPEDEEYIEADKIEMQISIEGRKVFFGVKSERQTGNHVIYYDGEKVWDPNPAVMDGRRLSSYKIVDIIPLTEIA